MKQIQTFTSTYTADVSGVPSALYELGGMTIMHDASGCNSTYNTHDEPRYYDSKSMVFISALTEVEAIMGDDQKLVDDIVKAAKNLKPRFIALAGTPIPMITGFDIKANANVIEAETGIPTLGINTNGMHSYVEGAGEALFQYGKRFIKNDVKRIENGINVLGATPIDFSINGQIESIEKFLTDSGFNFISNFALNCDVSAMENAATASVNLVISSVGIKLAEYLLEKYSIPYVVGVPYGNKLKFDIVNALHSAITYLDKNEMEKFEPIFATDFYNDANQNSKVGHSTKNNFEKVNIYIIGESITSKSLAKYIFYKYNFAPKVISAVELGNTFHGEIVKNMKVRKNVALENGDLFIEDEDEIRNALKNADMLIADPLYRPIVPEKTIFVSNPHEGFSGRLYRKQMQNLIDIL